MIGKDGWLAAVFAGFAIAAAVFHHLGSRWQNTIINALEARLSKRIYFRMMRLPYGNSTSSDGSIINF